MKPIRDLSLDNVIQVLEKTSTKRPFPLHQESAVASIIAIAALIVFGGGTLSFAFGLIPLKLCSQSLTGLRERGLVTS